MAKWKFDASANKHIGGVTVSRTSTPKGNFGVRRSVDVTRAGHYLGGSITKASTRHNGPMSVHSGSINLNHAAVGVGVAATAYGGYKTYRHFHPNQANAGTAVRTSTPARTGLMNRVGTKI